MEEVEQRPGPGRAAPGPRARVPDWAAALRQTLVGTVDIVVSLVLAGLFASAVTLALLVSVVTAWILGIGVLVRAASLQLSARLADVDRRRLGRLGVTVGAVALPEPAPGASFRERQLAWGRARWLWRLPAYQVVRLPVAGAMAFVAMSWWWAVVVAFVLAAGAPGPVQLVGWEVGPTDPGPIGTLVLVAAGLVGIGLWPALARGAVDLDGALARTLLAPDRRGELAAEVSRLSEARSLAVESAEAERRRIERDLHDGLQPQLVSLALELGLARSRLARDPASAGPMVERAHEEAKRATEDLRNLVRGIHPAVLDERGLDAALSALVANCAVPVSVDVDLGGPVDRAREATAYFVVAEAVTNVTKHARATRASVTVTQEGSTLLVVVTDDGRGGAAAEPGGGLSGLSARVAAVDGVMTVTSPPGGPTRIEAVIPCGP